MIKALLVYSLLFALIGASFLSCEKTNTPIGNFKTPEYPISIAVDSGYSSIEFGKFVFEIYSPRLSTGVPMPLIVGFSPTSGTNKLIRGVLQNTAKQMGAILLCPDFDNRNQGGFDSTIDTLLTMPQFRQDSIYFSGYSAGGGYAFHQGQRFLGSIKGLVLLASARGTKNHLFEGAMPSARTCFCSGTEDVVYAANLELYHLMEEANVPVKFIDIEGYDHGSMFSASYGEQVSECFDFVGK